MSHASKPRLLTLAAIHAELKEGTVRLQTVTRPRSKSAVTGAPPPFALVDALTGKPIQPVLGHGAHDPALSPVVANDPGPPASNPASKVLFCFVEVPVADQEHVRFIYDHLLCEVFRLKIVPDATTLADVKARTQLPFSVPEVNAATGQSTGSYGVWTRWFVDCPYATPIVEMTRVEGEPSTSVTYPPERVLRGMHIAQVVDLTPFEVYKDKWCMNAIARLVSVDSTQANHDAEFVRPVRMGRSVKMAVPLLAAGVPGYFVLGSEDPTAAPAWVAADDTAALATCRIPLTLETMATKLETDVIKFERKTTTKATDKHPLGSVRTFLNDLSTESNVITVLGDFDTSRTDRPYVAVAPHVHKDSLDQGSMSSLVSFPAKTDRDTWRRIHTKLYEQAIDTVLAKPGARKRVSLETAQGLVKFPGIDPAVDDPTKPRTIDYDEATDTYSHVGEDGIVREQHMVAYVKMRMEAPKGIEQLRTRFFEVNAPDEPFSAVEVDGREAVARGRHPLFITEWSELADMKGQRIILHTKFVLLQAEVTGPASITWDDVSA
jgi:hypothetical protein